jgi:hypothetical protein
MDLSRAGFYRWKDTEQREVSTPEQERKALLHERGLAHHEASDGTDGAPRIAANLREETVTAERHSWLADPFECRNIPVQWPSWIGVNDNPVTEER